MRSILIVACCWHSLVLAVCADDTAPAPVVRTLVVPLEHPEQWPAGDWQEVSADEYAAFVDWLNQSETSSTRVHTLGVAEYFGEFNGDDLIEGEAIIQLQSTTAQSKLIPLGEFSLRLQDLDWNDETPVVWGTGLDDNSYLWVDQGRGHLAAEWMQKGLRFDGGSDDDVDENSELIRFDLQLPTAVSSRIRLRVPSAQLVRCTAGVISGTEAIPGSDLNEWTIECGSSSRIAFLIMDASAAAVQSPWTADLVTVASARTDGLHFDADLTIESSVGLPAELNLRIPRDLSVTAVRTISDTAVEYRVTGSGSRRSLRIILPQTDVQRSVVRVRGIMPLSTRRAMVFPYVTISGASGVTASWTLQVDRPLELRSISPQGLQQTTLAVAAQRESWNFSPLNGEPRLAFEVGYPETSVTGRSWSLVDLANPVPQLVSVTELQCLRGTLFGSEWNLPRDWSVVSVRSPDVRIATWNSTVDPEVQNQTLRVEYRDPVDAGNSVVVEIIARSPPWHVDETHPLPLARYQNETLESILSVRLPEGRQWRHNSVQLSALIDSEGDEEAPAAVVQWWNETIDRIERWEIAGDDDTATCRLVDVYETAVESSRLELGGTTQSDDVLPGATELRARVSVQTHIAGANRSHHMHRCRLALQPHGEFDFHFTFERAAELLNVFVDGRSVEPQLFDHGFQLPVTAGVRELQIDYLTPADIGIFTVEEFPLPIANVAPVVVEWEFLLPSERTVSTRPEGVTVTSFSGELDLSQRLLGPLARGRSDSISWFSPLSRHIETQTSRDEGRSAPIDRFTLSSGDTSRRSLLLVAAGDLSSVRLELWDVHVVRSASWTSLLGAFLFLLTLRWLAPRSWKYVCLFVVATAFAVAWFAVPPAAVTAGGIMMGAILAIAVPRSLIQPTRDPADEQRQVSERRTSVVVSSSVAFLAAALLAQGFNRVVGDDVQTTTAAPSYDVLIPTASDDSGTPGLNVMLGSRLQPLFESWRQNVNALPSCLLNSASYELSFPDESLPVVSAVLEVFIRDSDVREILLPFRDVVIVGSTDVKLNDQPAVLIPASNGVGFLLMVPENWKHSSSPAEGEEVVSPDIALAEDSQSYTAATISLSFRVRNDDGAESLWSAGIPRISQSQVAFSSENSAQCAIASSLDQSTDGDSCLLPMQPTSTLAIARDDRSLNGPLPEMSVVSSIALGPGLSTVKAAIHLETPDVSTEPLVVPVRLPAESIVRGVQPAGKVGFVVEQRQDAVVLWLELRPAELLGTSIEIDYLLVTPMLPTEELQLPPLQYCHRQQSGTHQLQVTPRTGFQWGSRPRSSDGFIVIEPQIPIDGDTPARPLVSPTTVVVELEHSSETLWDLVPIHPARQATISDRIEIGTGHSRWSTNISMTSNSHPSFLYDFEVDPRIVIQSVSVMRDGADRMLRWRQDRDRLVVFVQGEQTGTHNISISGDFETPRSTAFRLPRFEISDVLVESRETSLVNLSSLPVILDSTSNGDRRLDPTEEVALSSGTTQRPSVPATLRFEETVGAVVVTETIWLMPADGVWTIWQRFLFEDSDGSLAPQTVWIPVEWDHISANATGSSLTEGTNAESRFIQLDAVDNTSIELNLLTRVAIDDGTMPVATLNTIPATTTLLLPRSIAIRSVDWREVTDSEDVAPPPPEGFSQISGWVAYRRVTQGATLPALPNAATASRLEIIRWETDVFCSTQSIVGETRIDLLPGGQGVIPLHFPTGATVLEISVNGDIIAWNESELAIPLPKESPAAIVKIVWTADSASEDSERSLENLIPRPTQDEVPPLYVCCWNQSEGIVLLPRESREMTARELWRSRWEDLYVLAEQSGAAVTHDLQLLHRIHQCESAIRRLPESSSASGVSDDLTQLSDRWEALRQSWPEHDTLADSLESDSLPSRWPSWDADLGGSGSVRIYEVTVGDEVSSGMQIAPAEQAWQRFLIGAGLTVLIVLIGTWGLRRTTRLAWDDRLAKHPRIAWLLLGIVWWLFLSPSMLGALIVVLVVAYAIGRGTRRLLFGGNGTTSPATASSHGH